MEWLGPTALVEGGGHDQLAAAPVRQRRPGGQPDHPAERVGRAVAIPSAGLAEVPPVVRRDGALPFDREPDRTGPAAQPVEHEVDSRLDRGRVHRRVDDQVEPGVGRQVGVPRWGRSVSRRARGGPGHGR